MTRLSATEMPLYWRWNHLLTASLSPTEGNGPGKEVIKMAKATTRKIGRNAGNGQFTTVKKAQQAPKTHVVETIKKPK
jgi:hypothetical protein